MKKYEDFKIDHDYFKQIYNNKRSPVIASPVQEKKSSLLSVPSDSRRPRITIESGEKSIKSGQSKSEENNSASMRFDMSSSANYKEMIAGSERPSDEGSHVDRRSSEVFEYFKDDESYAN